MICCSEEKLEQKLELELELTLEQKLELTLEQKLELTLELEQKLELTLEQKLENMFGKLSYRFFCTYIFAFIWNTILSISYIIS